MRQAETTLRALAASLEERDVAPLPVGVLRWNHRRRGLDGKVDDRPLPFRQVRRRAWIASSDDTPETLAVTSSGILWRSALLETGPTLLLAGHGAGVKFLSWGNGNVQFGPQVAFISVVGWGYEHTDEVPLDRLADQTLAAYARDPLWYLSR